MTPDLGQIAVLPWWGWALIAAAAWVASFAVGREKRPVLHGLLVLAAFGAGVAGAITLTGLQRLTWQQFAAGLMVLLLFEVCRRLERIQDLLFDIQWKLTEEDRARAKQEREWERESDARREKDRRERVEQEKAATAAGLPRTCAGCRAEVATTAFFCERCGRSMPSTA